MMMEDWSSRIDKFLLADDTDILKYVGKISHEIACDKALTEFEKYRVKQDKLYKSDFDNFLNEARMIEMEVKIMDKKERSLPSTSINWYIRTNVKPLTSPYK